MKTFKAQVLTPEGTIFDGEVTGVRVPGAQGSFEVMALHANIISTIEIGDILVRKPNGEREVFAVTGGFVEVVDNTLTLLAEAAEHIEEIDIDRAEAAKQRAMDRLKSEENVDKERAQRALRRAKNRLHLAMNVSVSTTNRSTEINT